MKTLLMVCAFFLLGLVNPLLANTGIVETDDPVEVKCENDDDKLKIKISVNFGRPKHGCSGFGVCSVDIETALRVAGPSGNSAVGYASNNRGRLQLEVLKSSMTTESLGKRFAEDVFIMHDELEMSRSLVNELGLRSNTLEPGIYEVQDKGEMIVITF